MKLKLDIDKTTCLHCVWVDALRAKFPKYKGGKDGKDKKSWEDIMHSAVVIAGRVASMMTKEEQIEFFRHIVQAAMTNDLRDRMMARGLTVDTQPMTVEELKAFLESLSQPKQ